MRKILDKRFSEAVALIIIVSSCLEARSSEEFSFAALFLSPLMYVLERRKAWIIVSIVPISYFLLYSLLSHFIPRYSEPLIPVSFLCLMMFFVDAVSRIISPLAVKLRD